MKSRIIKRCSDCGRFLSEDNFNWQNGKKSSRQSYCKRCNGNRNYLWRLYNKEKCSKYFKEYCKNNQEKRHECQKRWLLNNIEYNKEYYVDNKEQFKQYYKDNKEKYRKYHKENKKHRNHTGKQWREYNKEYCREYQRQYRQDNPDKCNILMAKRRARKVNQTVKLTEIEIKRILILYKFSNILGKYFQVDHIQPISKGGLHHPDNLQILTTSLNLEKSDKWPFTKNEKTKYKGFRI